MGVIRSLVALTQRGTFIHSIPIADLLDVVTTVVICFIAICWIYRRRLKYRTSLLSMPNEMLLNIADHLDPEHQILFALSCKRLYYQHKISHILASHQLSEKPARVRFLRILERDHPEYVTCSGCGILYAWQGAHNNDHFCQSADAYNDDPILYNPALVVLPPRSRVDLVLRGPQKGLPLSRLHFSGGYMDVERTTEARFVQDQLILFSKWTWDIKSFEYLLLSPTPMNTPICWHRKYSWRYYSWLLWRCTPGGTKVVKTDLKKCSFCATEFEVQMTSTPTQPIVVTVNVWHNLGSRDCQSAEANAVFDPYAPRLPKDVILGRNLKRLFNSVEVSLWHRVSRAFLGSERQRLPQSHTVDSDYIPAM